MKSWDFWSDFSIENFSDVWGKMGNVGKKIILKGKNYEIILMICTVK